MAKTILTQAAQQLRNSCRFLDAQTYEMEFKNNEKVTFSLTRQISDEGKKMVVTRKDAEGKTTSELTLEKTN